jgi:hypothetical protein
VAERNEPAGNERVRDDVDSTEQDDRWHRPGEGGGDDTARILEFHREIAEDDDGDLMDVDEIGEEPVDLAALQADDALLDALGGTNPEVPARDDHQVPDLETLLVAWRRDVDAAPIGDLIDVDAAVVAIAEGRRPSHAHRRYLVPLATAAAVLMIAFTGVGLAARNALPGDMLWGVAQVLYTDHAREVQAATSARIELANANAAFLQGDRVAAEAALERAQEQMRQVDAEHGLAELRSAQASLAAKVDAGDSTSASSSSPRPHGTPPSVPPPSMPAVTPEPPIVSSSSGPPSESTSPSPSSPPSTSTSNSSYPPSTTGGRGLFGGSTN